MLVTALPLGSIDMGGMFTVLKVRDDLAAGDERDPRRYRHPPGTIAQRVAIDPAFAAGTTQSNAAPAAGKQTDQQS
ncbi:MAG: copper oxidase [Nevskia sp.]|nr:copper oxidase [Nevskia sp.]